MLFAGSEVSSAATGKSQEEWRLREIEEAAALLSCLPLTATPAIPHFH
jgi:hypothetical protein